MSQAVQPAPYSEWWAAQPDPVWHSAGQTQHPQAPGVQHWVWRRNRGGQHRLGGAYPDIVIYTHTQTHAQLPPFNCPLPHFQVFATGYNFSFPFLPSNMLPVSGNKANLYKYMFPPGLERPTLVVIGLVQPLGAIMPISEMQARWATRVFKGTSLFFYQTLAHLFNFPHSLSLFVLFPQAYLSVQKALTVL